MDEAELLFEDERQDITETDVTPAASQVVDELVPATSPVMDELVPAASPDVDESVPAASPVVDELEPAASPVVDELEPAEGLEADEVTPGQTDSPDVHGVVGAPEQAEWFVIHCYSGYENKVKHNLEQRIESMNMRNQIFQVVVPTEEEIEVRDGKRRTVERRVFPGYILVQMLMDEESWYVVRNTPGVTGFVGMGNKPTALRPEEVQGILKRMQAEAPKVKVTFMPGQKVRIIDGPFNDFMGMVDEIDMDKAKVRVMVSFFGRETPVELDFLQVEKM